MKEAQPLGALAFKVVTLAMAEATLGEKAGGNERW